MPHFPKEPEKFNSLLLSSKFAKTMTAFRKILRDKIIPQPGRNALVIYNMRIFLESTSPPTYSAEIVVSPGQLRATNYFAGFKFKFYDAQDDPRLKIRVSGSYWDDVRKTWDARTPVEYFVEKQNYRKEILSWVENLLAAYAL